MVRKFFLMLMTVSLASCGWQPGRKANPYREEYEFKPASPLVREGIDSVAVLMVNATRQVVDVREAAELFSVELQQFGGVRVYPAAVVQSAAVSTKARIPEDAHLFARTLGVDVLLVGFITDWHPYDKPRVGLMLRLYRAAASTEAEPGTADAMLTLERVYDADTPEVAAQVRAFAAGREGMNTPLGERQYFMVMSKYMQFVADRATRDLFAKASQQGLRLGRPTSTQPTTPTTPVVPAAPMTGDAGTQDIEKTPSEEPTP